jgi:hypothetical protein
MSCECRFNPVRIVNQGRQGRRACRSGEEVEPSYGDDRALVSCRHGAAPRHSYGSIPFPLLSKLLCTTIGCEESLGVSRCCGVGVCHWSA